MYDSGMDRFMAGADDEGGKISKMIEEFPVDIFAAPRVGSEYYATVHLNDVGLEVLDVVFVLLEAFELVHCLETDVRDV